MCWVLADVLVANKVVVPIVGSTSRSGNSFVWFCLLLLGWILRVAWFCLVLLGSSWVLDLLGFVGFVWFCLILLNLDWVCLVLFFGFA